MSNQKKTRRGSIADVPARPTAIRRHLDMVAAKRQSEIWEKPQTMRADGVRVIPYNLQIIRDAHFPDDGDVSSTLYEGITITAAFWESVRKVIAAEQGAEGATGVPLSARNIAGTQTSVDDQDKYSTQLFDKYQTGGAVQAAALALCLKTIGADCSEKLAAAIIHGVHRGQKGIDKNRFLVVMRATNIMLSRSIIEQRLAKRNSETDDAAVAEAQRKQEKLEETAKTAKAIAASSPVAPERSRSPSSCRLPLTSTSVSPTRQRGGRPEHGSSASANGTTRAEATSAPPHSLKSLQLVRSRSPSAAGGLTPRRSLSPATSVGRSPSATTVRSLGRSPSASTVRSTVSSTPARSLHKRNSVRPSPYPQGAASPSPAANREQQLRSSGVASHGHTPAKSVLTEDKYSKLKAFVESPKITGRVLPVSLTAAHHVVLRKDGGVAAWDEPSVIEPLPDDLPDA